MPSVRWADIPQPSTRDGRCPAAWQQSGPDGTDRRPSAFRRDISQVGAGSCERRALWPVAAVSRWPLLLLSLLLSAAVNRA